MTRRKRSLLATVLGLLTSVFTALAVIDFGTFDISKDYLKLFVIIIPAVTGYLSSINAKKQNGHI